MTDRNKRPNAKEIPLMTALRGLPANDPLFGGASLPPDLIEAVNHLEKMRGDGAGVPGYLDRAIDGVVRAVRLHSRRS